MRARYSTRHGASGRSHWTGPFLLLVSLLLVGLLTVSGARDDILSLLYWRPLTSIALGLAVAWCGAAAWEVGKPPLLLLTAVISLTVLHLIPLPPALWTALPGREIIVSLYRDLGMDLPWQPLSLAQTKTWNALFSLAAPAAALVAALTLTTTQHRRVLIVILAMGALSGLLGLLQAIGPARGPLYFYKITNVGMAVGLFANRNHQAMFMATLFPMLAAYLSMWSGTPERLVFQRVLVGVSALFLIPLLLITGSRAGLLLGIAGMLLAWWIYQPTVARGRAVGATPALRMVQIGALVGAVIGIALLTAAASRTSAIDRLLGSATSEELRLLALPTILDATGRFFPVGIGIGTFVEAYKYFEPYALLSQNYLNHAHNDLAEVLLTAGAPGALLIVAAAAMVLRAAWALARARLADARDRDALILGRTGLSIVVLLALGSIGDYPLRVPSVAVIAMIAVAWTTIGYRSLSSQPSNLS